MRSFVFVQINYCYFFALILFLAWFPSPLLALDGYVLLNTQSLPDSLRSTAFNQYPLFFHPYFNNNHNNNNNNSLPLLLSGPIEIPSPITSLFYGPSSFNLSLPLHISLSTSHCINEDGRHDGFALLMISGVGIFRCNPEWRTRSATQRGAAAVLIGDSDIGPFYTDAGSNIYTKYDKDQSDLIIPSVHLTHAAHTKLTNELQSEKNKFIQLFTEQQRTIAQAFVSSSDNNNNNTIYLFLQIYPTENKWKTFKDSRGWVVLSAIFLPSLNGVALVWTVYKIIQFFRLDSPPHRPRRRLLINNNNNNNRGKGGIDGIPKTPITHVRGTIISNNNTTNNTNNTINKSPTLQPVTHMPRVSFNRASATDSTSTQHGAFTSSSRLSSSDSFFIQKIGLIIEAVGFLIRMIYCSIDFLFSTGRLRFLESNIFLTLSFSMQLLSMYLVVIIWKGALASDGITDSKSRLMKHRKSIITSTVIGFSLECLFGVLRGLCYSMTYLIAVSGVIYGIAYISLAIVYWKIANEVIKTLRSLTTDLLANQSAIMKEKLRKIDQQARRAKITAMMLLLTISVLALWATPIVWNVYVNNISAWLIFVVITLLSIIQVGTFQLPNQPNNNSVQDSSAPTSPPLSPMPTLSPPRASLPIAPSPSTIVPILHPINKSMHYQLPAPQQSSIILPPVLPNNNNNNNINNNIFHTINQTNLSPLNPFYARNHSVPLSPIHQATAATTEHSSPNHNNLNHPQ